MSFERRRAEFDENNADFEKIIIILTEVRGQKNYDNFTVFFHVVVVSKINVKCSHKVFKVLYKQK